MQISVSDPLSIIQSFLYSILMRAHLMLPYISTTTHQAIRFGITLPSDSQASSRFISLLLHVILTFTALPNLSCSSVSILSHYILTEKGNFHLLRNWFSCGFNVLYTSKYREARHQLSIITTLAGKEYYDSSEQSYEGSYRRLKYVGYETESFLILTFLREVSNVLPIPWDPLIPYCIFVCADCYNSTSGGSFDLQFPFFQPIKFKEHKATKALKTAKTSG
ncbi:hypothetical protein HID58_029552 [Brassica napus]|uniref:Uncharacterized protein n=1 Tax=Brassica napus TaxID=3708 RepID=A0ABQ8CDF3_BRANA|nr:hypothetical protein HID58_029552 [Brassica napus]